MKILNLFERHFSSLQDLKKVLINIPDFSGLSTYMRISKLNDWIENNIDDAVLLSDESKFALVYRIGGYVIRITHTPDPAYEKWVRYAKTISSPHVPNYYDMYRYGNSMNTVTVMEELTKVDIKTYRILDNLWDNINTREVKRFRKLHSEFMDIYFRIKRWSKGVRLNKNVLSPVKVGFDLHGDNVMKRGSTLVITDPVSYDIGDLHRISESTGYRLKDLCQVSLSFEDAHFWITRRGSDDTVGEVSKEYNPESYGIGVIRTDVIDPQYLYYAMQHLHSTGHWKQVARGVLQLVSIRKEDIENIQLG